MVDCNNPAYWDEVWRRWRHDDKITYLKAMADRANTKEYWDSVWTRPSRRVEKYSMQYAWWKVGEYKARSVLDVACGNGRLLFGVKQIKPDAELFGIDISQVAIDRMKKEYGIDGAVMNAYEVDKLEKNFDFIVANHLLEHLWCDEEFVRKCKSKLNPGGIFFAAVPNNCSSPEETEEHVRMYDEKMLYELLLKVFGNAEMKVIGNHLIGLAKNT